MEPTTSTTQFSEDYLRCIYKLQKDDEAVATSRIAAAMGITAPSVTDMMQRLAHSGLVQYRRYGGVKLTATGRGIALEITRRHRLWEMFLVQTLNFGWDEVHEVADLLEHVTPPLLESRIDKFLGHPSFDPHGDPIPSKQGTMHRASGVSLAECSAGFSGSVSRVNDDRPEALQMLAKLGIALHSKLRVADVAAYDGSMTIRLGAKQLHLSKELAGTIFIEPLKR